MMVTLREPSADEEHTSQKRSRLSFPREYNVGYHSVTELQDFLEHMDDDGWELVHVAPKDDFILVIHRRVKA